jgi:hypothetical protein
MEDASLVVAAPFVEGDLREVAWRVRVAAMQKVLLWCVSIVLLASNPGISNGEDATAKLDAVEADRFAQLALAGIDREFPNKPADVLTSSADAKVPKLVHPAFYGSYDWHSSVHGHWLLIRLLRLYPDFPHAGEARARLREHLSAEALETEAAYFEKRENLSFERMYGWAWALRLAAELQDWQAEIAAGKRPKDEDVEQWVNAIAPLENKLVRLISNYLPRLTYPVRTGVHPDTAFALAQILDYARITHRVELEGLIVKRARDYFLHDAEYPARLEPSGEDFFSPGLNVADLMRRVLSRDDFSKWLDAYLPGLRTGNLGKWTQPAEVSDLTDPRIVHLVGLNLSRAWTMQGVLSALAPGDPRRAVLEKSEHLHADAGLRQVFNGHYEGEHWLATFAVYYLTKAGAR